MLQAPAHHLSRVCGHGHIKKFWLMQTQKENQSCDQGNKNSVIVSSASSSSSPIYGNRVSSSTSPTSSSSSSMKLLDVSQRCSPTHITTNHVNTHLTASSSGFGESPSAGITHSSSSNFSRGIGRSLCQRPSSLSSKECEKAILQEDSSSEAQVLNVSFSSSSSYSSPTQTSSINLLSTVEIASMNDTNHEEVYREDGSPPDPTLESKLTSINAYRDSISKHKIQETVPFVTPSSDGKILVSKLNEGENVVSGAKTDLRESGIHLHKSSGYEVIHQNHVSSKGNLNSADSCAALRKTEARPIAPDNISKWKSRNSSSNGNRIEVSPRGSTQLVLKACSLCGTTKTPMWRSGPQGPKSLCNACGIRFKKYRSFPGHNDPDLEMPLIGNSSPSSKYLSRPLKRKQNNNTFLTQEVGLKPFASDVSRHQKKSKWHQLVIKRDQVDLLRDTPNAWKVSSGPASLKKIYGCMQSRFKNLGSGDEHLDMKRVFAKDEEEAAVLLMHLSCDLVC